MLKAEEFVEDWLEKKGLGKTWSSDCGYLCFHQLSFSVYFSRVIFQICFSEKYRQPPNWVIAAASLLTQIIISWYSNNGHCGALLHQVLQKRKENISPRPKQQLCPRRLPRTLLNKRTRYLCQYYILTVIPKPCSSTNLPAVHTDRWHAPRGIWPISL